jgi:hypothetical protein
MKLVILVPTRDYMGNAGARIRYSRLAPALADKGVTLSMVEISMFDPVKSSCDVVIVSKCYDARALVAAALLARRGVPVGVDVFDDYFSQSSDSRLGRLRSWLRQMLSFSSFILCSTPAMAERVRQYPGALPIHVVNDPAQDGDVSSIARALDRKISATKSEGVFRLAWFGVGDNPYFPVGLSDVSGFARTLSPFTDRDVPLHLTILTNARALGADGLSRLAELPFEVEIDEWSEQKEADLLGTAMACFLPVNAQSFSTAKSLNRAVTALTAGCQVLTAGYPLYERLEPFIYTSADSLIDDFERGELRHSPDRLGEFERSLSALAFAPAEAAALADFLTQIAAASRAVDDAGPLFLIHGLASSRPAHERARVAGILTVSTPFCAAPLESDVIVRMRPDGSPVLLVSDKAFGQVRADLRRLAKGEHKVGRRKFRQLGEWEAGSAGTEKRSLPLQLAQYEPVISQTVALLSDAFGEGTAILSENSPLTPEVVI